MIRKVVPFIAMLVLAATAALAQLPDDTEVLLTPGGTFFTVSGAYASDHPDAGSAASRFLLLSARTGDDVETFAVPGTLTRGAHSDPALAFDAESETLFVFWKHTISVRESVLVVASRDKDGNWSELTEFATSNNYWRTNLRIGITHVSTLAETALDGGAVTVSDLNIHATWWEDRAHVELARYALLSVEDGKLTVNAVKDLYEFTGEPVANYGIQTLEDEQINREFLRHPAIVESQDRASVEIVFGDMIAKKFNRVRLTTVVDGRIRIPLGVKTADTPAPKFRTTVDGRVNVIAGARGRLLFHFDGETGVRYIVNDDGEWSNLRSIALDEHVTKPVAIEAIRRMANSE